MEKEQERKEEKLKNRVPIIILIDKPEMIAFIKEVHMKQKTVGELKQKIPRRKVYECLKKSEYYKLKLRAEIKNYIKDPLREEVEFIKYFVGITKGRRTNCIKLSEDLHVEYISDTEAIIKIYVDEIEAKNKNLTPSVKPTPAVW